MENQFARELQLVKFICTEDNSSLLKSLLVIMNMKKNAFYKGSKRHTRN